jgi:sugar phosphate isomerase/epimerase
MKTPAISKREFLKLSVTGLAGAYVSTSAAAGFAPERKKIPLGLQLYSLRKECAKDLEGTIAAVGKMGYKGVEFAGYHGRDAKTLRKLLDDAGLKCCGTHTALDTLLGDKLAQTIEFNKTLGNEYLIVPSLQLKYQKSKEAWQQAADRFNEVLPKATAENMRIGYHNHGVEFTPINGEMPWDIFFNRAKKDVLIQYDIGNAAHAGADAPTYLKKFPGRVASVHVKPYSKVNPDALIGDDEMPWSEIFKLCEGISGVKWYIIEYERENEPALVSVEKLRKILCDLGKC